MSGLPVLQKGADLMTAMTEVHLTLVRLVSGVAALAILCVVLVIGVLWYVSRDTWRLPESPDPKGRLAADARARAARRRAERSSR